MENTHGHTWLLADDMYVSASFARTLAHGHGLRYRPLERRCWRGFAPSGHNKEDVVGALQVAKTRGSVVPPPQEQRNNYVPFTYAGHSFYGLRNTKLVRWGRVHAAL